MSHLGLVQLELDFNGRKLNYSVPPIQATIIWHFQDKQIWTINELSEVMAIPPSILRRRIALWQNKGILKETTTDRFVLIEDERIVSSHSTQNNETLMNIENDFDDDLGNDKSSASILDEREEKLTLLWSFIVNMLNNLNSLPLERIHTMLQMFAIQSTNSNELTTHELRHFLDSKVREQKLSYSNGQYKLNDNNN
jgi:anaphase-promoting complex subunit 2